MTINKKKWMGGLVSLLIPIIVLLIIFAILGVIPFGDKTLLTIDLRGQYISFFSYLKNVLQGNASLTYSFTNGFGGEMVGLIAYYLVSPFNLLFLFADLIHFPTIISIIFLLKIGSSSLTMYLYLSSKRKLATSIFGGVAYSLTAFNFAYYSNIMWFDVLLLLPLVLLGLDRILEGKKSPLYLISLFLLILSNYYMAYIVCLFIAIYFFANVIFSKSVKQKKFKAIKHFVIHSLAAGLLAGFLLVPLALTLSGGQADKIAESAPFFQATVPKTGILSKFFFGAFDNGSYTNDGFPHIYMNVMFYLLYFLYFLDRKFSLREKLTSLSVISILFLALSFEGLNIIFHAMTTPAWFHYRFSFLIPVVFIIYGTKELDSIFSRESKGLIWKSTLLGVLAVVASFLVLRKNFEYLPASNVYLTVGLLALYAVLLIGINGLRKARFVQIMTALMSLIVLGELTANGAYMLDYFNMKTYPEYHEQISQIENQLAEVPDEEGYRLEKTYHFNNNDPMMFNYSGLSHFSSTAKTDDKDFLAQLGYRNKVDWSKYETGSTLPADSLFGIKHQLQPEGIRVNEYALPLGFQVPNYNDEPMQEPYQNVFEYTDRLYNSLGNSTNFFERISNADIPTTYENLKAVPGDESNYQLSKLDPDEPAAIEMTVPSDQPVYFQFENQTSHEDGANVYINGESEADILENDTHNVLGAKPVNGAVEIRIELKSDILRYDDFIISRFNQKAFEDFAREAQNETLNIHELRDGYINGEITADESNSMLVLSVPFDESWNIEVDGETVEPIRVADNLIGIQLANQGKTYQIEMNYQLAGLRIGIILSLVTLTLTVAYYKFDRD